ncbi:MAG: DUF1566 domain-containing protein [Polyangiaceae bacterium]|nr:DUF1566 domain-containing protein [Polyangiaceae bacterium]
MFGRTGRTAMGGRVAVFVGTLLMVGACVQIAGIDDPHPKDPGQNTDGTGGQNTGGTGGQNTGGTGGQDAGPDAEPDAPPDAPHDPEWANWPMPNPPEAGLPNPASYEINTGKGVVTDTVTNLMWQRDLDAGSLSWATAKTYCNGSEHAGYTDWRLPTAIELASLVDFTKASPGPTIDTDAFPNTPADWFWTATQDTSAPNSAWFISFNTGQTSSNDKGDEYQVRCVR